MEYTVDYFIAKFEAIPEDKWVKYRLFDDEGRHCVNGYCGVLSNDKNDRYGKLSCSFRHTEESNALAQLFGTVGQVPVCVNDGSGDIYTSGTPKQRILEVLYRIRGVHPNIEEKEVPKPKEIIRYVSVPESIKEQKEELILN